MDLRRKSNEPRSSRDRQRRQNRSGAATLRLVALLALAFVLGALIMSVVARKQATTAPDAAPRPLSVRTQSVLQSLASPVTLRYYAVLGPAGSLPELEAYARRVDQLLALYEQESSARLKVTRVTAGSEETSQAASNDGLKPFNLEHGDPCYFGIALSSGENRQALPRLDPEWEQALEPDLTRAIEQVVAPPRRAVGATVEPVDRRAAEEVRRILPELATMSLEQGKQALRSNGVQRFSELVKRLEAPLAEAQKKVLTAQQGGSEPEFQAAKAELQRLQAEQAEQMKELAAELQAQLAALEQIKAK